MCVHPQAYTHSVSTVGRNVVIVGGISKLNSVLTGFGLATEGTFSVRDSERNSLLRCKLDLPQCVSVRVCSHFGPPHSTAEALTTGSVWKPTGSTLSVFCSTASKMADPS